MGMLERRRVFKVCGQGTSARRSSRFARTAHRQKADMEPCIRGGDRGVALPACHIQHPLACTHVSGLDQTDVCPP